MFGEALEMQPNVTGEFNPAIKKYFASNSTAPLRSQSMSLLHRVRNEDDAPTSMIQSRPFGRFTPSATSDLPAEATDKCRLVLRSFGRALGSEKALAVARQLETILSNNTADDGDTDVSLVSLIAALEYLSRTDHRHPNMSLRPNGNFVLAWVQDRQKRLQIEFLSRERANWLSVDASIGPEATRRGTISPAQVTSYDQIRSDWFR